MAPAYRDVERVIQAVPGVASASVAPVGDTGRGRLRIRLETGRDPDEVSGAVATQLRERFGLDIDPAALLPDETPQAGGDELVVVDDGDEPAGDEARAQPSPEPARVAGPRRGRPVIEVLSVETEGLEVHASVRLRVDGRELRGRATAATTREATFRAVARATLSAVDEIAPGRFKTELEALGWGGEDGAEHCTVTVTFVTPEGPERLIGASLVRDDPHEAIVRASLDAVNRRITR